MKTIAATGLVVASVSLSQAQPYYLAGHFEGWCNNCSVMTDNGLVGTNGIQGSHQYEYDITGQTPNSYDNNGQGMKVTDGTWNNTWPGNNMYVYYGAAGTLSVYFYPGTFTDGWFPTANRVGYSDNGSPWEVTGTLTTPQYGSDPNAQMTLVAGSTGVYTNIYVVATPGTYQWKCRTSGTWNDMQAGTDFSDNPGTLGFTTTSANQAVKFTLDLPNGRLSASVPPVFCNVQFSVDMSLIAAVDPSFSHVSVDGDNIGGWSDNICTNNPSAANPNIYTSSNIAVIWGTPVQYQFRYVDGSGHTQYDAKGNVGGVNRTLTIPNLSSTNIPVVYWNDIAPNTNELLNVDTTVTFSLNMTNAIGYTNGVIDRVFIPGTDFVVINHTAGSWLPWGGNPVQWNPYELVQDPSGNLVYTWTTTYPAGTPRGITYKYGINGNDDEAFLAGYSQNHVRYIRSTNGTYNMPMDTFGTIYQEPKVGGLTVGPVSGGTVPVSWLPYPNVHLQHSSDLIHWLDVVPDTTGAGAAALSAGSGSQFFRLFQPAE